MRIRGRVASPLCSAPLACVLALAVAGCAGPAAYPALDEAHAAVERARSVPRVRALAAAELDLAEIALEQAGAAARAGARALRSNISPMSPVSGRRSPKRMPRPRSPGRKPGCCDAPWVTPPSSRPWRIRSGGRWRERIGGNPLRWGRINDSPCLRQLIRGCARPDRILWLRPTKSCPRTSPSGSPSCPSNRQSRPKIRLSNSQVGGATAS